VNLRVIRYLCFQKKLKIENLIIFVSKDKKENLQFHQVTFGIFLRLCDVFLHKFFKSMHNVCVAYDFTTFLPCPVYMITPGTFLY
jgi:hypothetical protein